MKKVVFGFMIFVFLFITGVVSAQSAQSGYAVVNGLQNPSEISDAVSYRHLLTDLTDQAFSSELPNIVAAQPFSPADQQIVLQNLTAYRTQFNALVDSYNQQAELADATAQPVSMSFDSEVAALVEQTQTNLQSSLSTGGLATLNALAQAEKLHIRVYSSRGSMAGMHHGARLVEAALSCTPSFNVNYTISTTEVLALGQIVSGKQQVNLIVSSTVSGTTTMTEPPGCTIGPNVVHTPTASVTLGTLSNIVHGTPKSPQSFITATASITTLAANGTTVVFGNGQNDDGGIFGDDDYVQCTVAGVFYGSSLPKIQLEIADEYTATSGTGPCVPFGTGYLCSIPQINWCSSCVTTIPPGPGGVVQGARDLNVLSVNKGSSTPNVVGSPYYWNIAVCERSTPSGNPETPGGWSCAPPLSTALVSLPGLQHCTYFPYQP